MNLFESFVSATASLLGNKMRSVLTMLGIIIGISAVIMITSIGQGFQASINGQFSKMGSLGLEVGVKYDEDVTTADMLTLDDASLIVTHPNVENVSPLASMSGKARLKNPAETNNLYFMGTNENFKDVQGLDITEGRFLARQDVDNKAAAIIIDSTLARKLYGKTKATGQTLHATFSFGNVDFTVVGVYHTVDFGSSMFQMPTIAYIPVTTLQKIYGRDYLDNIYVNVKDRAAIERTALEISMLLSMRHGNEGKYNVSNLLQQLDSVNDVLGGITAFVSLVAAISLFVGGIGVMNIMLVTVTERTHEIGIRKSLGATDGNIRFQFLVEAVILAAIGGLIGIALGYCGGVALGGVIDVVPVVSAPTVAFTVIISSLVGIVFGVYPAGKAARLDPIEALRHE
ncbi:MAG: ABC transporter permease [Clostridiales Family XIII bacterium]|jgi:putative ABC transport system permease protein|nr:ABC transporter permease [Clostridiales Family XIII bacterium]